MKKSIYAILACFFLFGCFATKKVESTEKSAKESVERTNTERDSVVNTTKTLGIENETEFDLDYLAGETGDFSQTVSSGPDSEFTIEKKGNKLKVRSKTPDVESTNTTVNEKKEEFRYDSEYVYTEVKTLIRRVPFRFWVYIGIVVAIFFRKGIAQLIVMFFPGMATKRIISVLLGTYKKT